MRTIKRITLFPVVLLLMILGLAVDIIIEIESRIGGIALLLFVVLYVLCIFNKLWLQMGIITGFIVAGFLIIFLSVIIKIFIESAIEWLKA